MDNIFDEFSSSLKAKLCEFQYSSFLISFVISGILINHKYLMIYYSNIDPSRKLLMLDYQGVYVLLPLLFSLFYIFIYPYFANEFYSKSLEFGNAYKKTKVDKLKKRILDEDDAKSYVDEIEKLNTKLDKKTQFVSKMENEYTSRMNDLEKSHKTNIDEHEMKLEKLTSSYTRELSKLNSSLENKENLVLDFQNKIKQTEQDNESIVIELKNKIEQNKQDSEKLKFENTRYINESHKIHTKINILLDIIKKYDNFKAIPTEKKVEKLIQSGISFNIIDEILGLDKGYTQKLRPSIKIINGIKTTDEMLLREIHGKSEISFKDLLIRFTDLTEDELYIKIKKLLQVGHISKIGDTNHYYVTDLAKLTLNLK